VIRTGASPASDLFGDGDAARIPVAHWSIVAVAVLSGVLLWAVTRSYALAGGFVGMGLLAVAVLRAMGPRTVDKPADMADANDWALVRSVADQGDRAIAITDRNGRLVCANDAYCDWFGGAVTPPGLPVDARTNAVLADAGRAAWRDGEAAVTEFICNAMRVTGTIHRVGRAGDHLLWRWQKHVQADPVLDAARSINGSVGHAFGEAGVMAVIASASGTIRAANDAFRLRAGGAVHATVEGHDFAAALRVDKAGLIRFAHEREGEGATPLRIIEVSFDSADAGAPLLLLLVDEDGGAGERGIALDYIESLLSALPFGMAMVDRDGRFLFINAAFARAAGVEGQSPSYPSDLLVSEDKAALSEAIRRHAAGRSSSGNISVRLRNRADDATLIGLTGVRGMGAASVLLTMTPEADTPQLKQQLAQSAKMQAVGQLAGGIAHDFNNILTAILGSCDLMLMRHTPGDSDYDDIQHIRSNTNRAANLTRQLLAFSRQQTLRPQTLNLSDIVADVSHMLQRLLGERIELVVQHGRGLGTVRADPVQLEQVILNLAVNARDAMPRGGVLTIATAPVAANEVRSVQDEELAPGEYSLLTVTDTGTGIPTEIMSKIFDPFFTTKDLGKGTGLGLATVYGIVKQSGGYIFADSPPEGGTRFSIYFPVHRASPDEVLPGPTGPAVTRGLHWGSGTILLVEDEDMVRAVAERALVRAGYSVIPATHGEDGLEKFAEAPTVDLVVSDVMMPLMDGPTMVERLRAARPDMPVLFMSGYAEEQLRSTIALPNVSFLAKPFSVSQLVDAVATIKQASS
jgi:two-component system cell cycle sensor histidine kinase/response regulator CckA